MYTPRYVYRAFIFNLLFSTNVLLNVIINCRWGWSSAIFFYIMHLSSHKYWYTWYLVIGTMVDLYVSTYILYTYLSVKIGKQKSNIEKPKSLHFFDLLLVSGFKNHLEPGHKWISGKLFNVSVCWGGGRGWVNLATKIIF